LQIILKKFSNNRCKKKTLSVFKDDPLSTTDYAASYLIG
jgi:hypothetical protein